MVDATYGYNNVSKKASEQDVVIIMAARAGSTPALSTKGPVAEWLGGALQKLIQRFDSVRDLKKHP